MIESKYMINYSNIDSFRGYNIKHDNMSPLKRRSKNNTIIFFAESKGIYNPSSDEIQFIITIYDKDFELITNDITKEFILYHEEGHIRAFQLQLKESDLEFSADRYACNLLNLILEDVIEIFKDINNTLDKICDKLFRESETKNKFKDMLHYKMNQRVKKIIQYYNDN